MVYTCEVDTKFLSFCTKERDVIKWAIKLCVCKTRTTTLCVSCSCGAGNSSNKLCLVVAVVCHFSYLVPTPVTMQMNILKVHWTWEEPQLKLRSYPETSQEFFPMTCSS